MEAPRETAKGEVRHTQRIEPGSQQDLKNCSLLPRPNGRLKPAAIQEAAADITARIAETKKTLDDYGKK
jgi:hypothetical protein